jgi:F0F1-type ATP synthase membrane subunit c/vacuolar-type H+-ATPase subunit K
MTNREMTVRSLTFGFIGLGAGLLVGLGVLAHNARAQSPAGASSVPAVAPQGRYQYMCLGNLDPRLFAPEVQAKLNELGAQGWRLLETGTGGLDQYCFERRY